MPQAATGLFVAALGAIAGCQAPNPAYRPGASTDAAVRDAPVRDAPVPDAPMLDAALPDRSDDVPPASGCAATPDEDGDGVGDACDNCPVDPNPGQENAQEIAAGQAPDDLGDACDPRPASAGDSLVFLDGFEGTALDPAWQGARADFSVGEGALIYDGADDEEMPALTRVAAGDVLFVVAFSVTGWSAASENRNLWAGVRGDAAGDAYRCSVRRDSGGATMLAFFAYGDLAGPSVTRAEPIDIGVAYRLAARAQGSDITCDLGSATFVQRDATAPGDSVEIRVRRAAVRLHSAVAYRLGP